MHRRDLLQLLGSAAFAPALSRMSPEQRLDLAEFIHRTAKSAPKVLTPQQDALVVAVAEMIIPRTETPGATDAKVNEFVDTLLAGWYDDDDKRQFLHGLDAMDAEAMALGGDRPSRTRRRLGRNRSWIGGRLPRAAPRPRPHSTVASRTSRCTATSPRRSSSTR